MNFRNISNVLITFLLAFFTVYAIQGLLRFMMPGWFGASESSQAIQRGQTVYAPKSPEESQQPLQKIVSFAEYKGQPQITDVKTDYGVLFFNSNAGSLERIEFKQMISGNERVLTPFAASADKNRYGFMVSLDKESPLNYQLKEKKELDDATQLLYWSKSANAIIEKLFVVNKKVPRIDLKITVEPVGQQKIQPRLWVPFPYIEQADQTSPPMGLLYSTKLDFQRTNATDAALSDQLWMMPVLFGGEDKYFVSALISDNELFAKRAYFAGTTAENMNFVLEGPLVPEKKSWNLSFYYGPKDNRVMNVVDSRLDNTLDYGYLSPLVKILLVLLQWLFDLVKNFGWAIILLALLIRLFLLPMTLRGQKSLERQKEFQRKMQYIEHKYKNDPETLNRERLELTKKYGMSNISSCLPQLIQLPILIALNRLLSSSILLYQAPFVGWITDLSARDPYYVLPLLAGVGLFVQVSSDADTKRGITMLLFAAFLVAVTAHLPAGLTLYLCANTWLSIAQIYIQRKLKI